MTALYLDDPLPLKLTIMPIEGVNMSDIVDVVARKAAYIEIADRHLFEDKPLEFYFCDENGARLTVGDKSICTHLASRSSEPGEAEYAIYRVMGALDLLGEIEKAAHCYDGLVLVWVESFLDHSDVCGGTP